MNTQFEYKGRKVEIAWNQWGYIVIINGVDWGYNHATKKSAIANSKNIIDAEEGEAYLKSKRVPLNNQQLET